MTPFRQTRCKKICAAIISATLLLQPLGAYAATIAPTLAELPLQGLNPVKPNVMFTLDDSGSMAWDYLPDWAVWNQSSLYYCRESRQCGGDNGINVGSNPYPTGTPYTQIDPPLRSSDFNKIYYNPTATYSAGKKVDGTNLPCEGGNTACSGPWTAVYMNGLAGYPGANTNNTINLAPTTTTGCNAGATAALCVPTTAPSDTGPWPGVPDTLWCWKTSGLTAANYMTADGDGSICRRNGRTYSSATVSGITTPAITAGYNYPNNSDACTNTGSQRCRFISDPNNPITAYGYPYYYTISSVWFCSTATNGWGTSGCGTRQDFATTKYVRYAASASGAPGFDATVFKRVDITPSGILVNGVSAANPSGRTVAQEFANFAKFYAFNRTRHLATKTAGGIAFSNYVNSNQMRAGFHTLWENNSATAGFLNVTDFNTANAGTWFSHLYAVVPGNSTPLPDAAWRIGQYFSNASSGLPGAADPVDPTTGKCQPNYHLLSTDGYWNATLSLGSAGDKDKTVPALPAPVPGFTTGSNFPRPYYEGPTATSDNLADLAMYYWARDLRPTLANQVKDLIAPWQHVVLYGLSIGAQGNVRYPSGIDAITAGANTVTAPAPQLINWPVATGAGGPESIDDLWHAAVNSRGKFFNAQDPQQLAESIVTSLADFTDQSGTATPVSNTSAQLSVTHDFVYQTSFNPGWWGDLRKYTLDLNTGAIPLDANGNPVSPPIWSAASQLDAQAAVTASPAVVGWDVNRKIVTINDSTNGVVPFRLASLSAAQQSSLNAGWSSVTPQPTPPSVLNYLRGDQSNEGITATSFRARPHILGDIVFSAAVPVGAPSQPYDDAGNPGYTTFAANKASRTPMVYVGANDGMMHAFVDSAVVADAGKEAWAYIPKAVFSAGDPNDTAHTPSPDFQIGALTYRRGGIPLFKHRFYVNATPRVWDVDFANTKTSTPPQSLNDWRTLLVGGLGAGGRSVYALDVTNPVPLTDTEAAVASSGRVLWEYTDANLGYVFDSPTLVKTFAYGWVVLVASGYNNPGGKGFLYVLNPSAVSKTGELLLLGKIALPGDTGTDASPTGLSTIRAYTASRKNPYVLQAYGGDLKGNIWRFDLSDVNPANWKAAKIATLTDPSGKAQPITTGVRIEIDQNNNVDRYLFVGTGKLLDQADLNDTTVVNTMYVIRDGTRTAPDATLASTPATRANLNTVVAGSIAGFGTPGANTRGWYQDAANITHADGTTTLANQQKIVTDVSADVQTAVFAFSYPSADPCLAALQATLFARDFSTGTSVLQSAGGSVVASVDIGAGIAGMTMVQGQLSASGVPGNVSVQVTTLSGQVYSFGLQLQSAVTNKHRVSWRLINN